MYVNPIFMSTSKGPTTRWILEISEVWKIVPL